MTVKGYIHCITAMLSMLVCAACNSVPGGVLDKDEMASLLADIHKGEAAIDVNLTQLSSDSMKRVVRQSVYDAHHVTQEDVDSSLRYYGHHIEDYLEVYDKVIAQLETDLENSNAVIMLDSQITVAGDSVDTWAGAKRIWIDRKSPIQALTFELNRDENWEAGDIYSWSFKTINQHNNVDMRILVDYDNGMTEYMDAHTNADGWITATIKIDPEEKPMRIYGYAEFNNNTHSRIYIDSISLIRTRPLEGGPARIRQRFNTFNRPLK